MQVWAGWFEEFFASLAWVFGRADRRRTAMVQLRCCLANPDSHRVQVHVLAAELRLSLRPQRAEGAEVDHEAPPDTDRLRECIHSFHRDDLTLGRRLLARSTDAAGVAADQLVVGGGFEDRLQQPVRLGDGRSPGGLAALCPPLPALGSSDLVEVAALESREDVQPQRPPVGLICRRCGFPLIHPLQRVLPEVDCSRIGVTPGSGDPETGAPFKGTFDAPYKGYYRAHFKGSRDFQESYSAVVYAQRTPTRITDGNASPEPVHKGRTITYKGKLQKYTSGAWEAYADQKVKILFRPKGSSTWYDMGNTYTRSDGTFSKGFTASKDGTWVAVLLYPNSTHLVSSGREDYVDVI